MITKSFLTGRIFLILTLSALFPLTQGQAEDLFFKIDDQYQNVTVAKVISADTIQLDNGEKIQLIGLKAPQAPKRLKEQLDRDKYGFVIEITDPTNSIEDRAFEFSKYLLEGKSIRLEFDARKINDDFVTLAYVFLLKDGTFVNAEILKQGYASLKIQLPNTKYKEVLREAYKEARREKRGLQGN